MNKIIRQIKSSILLQLTGIVFLIIIVLITTMVMLQNYIGAMERKNAETLCESLMEQSSDALGLYQEKLRYQASLFCRLPLETFLKEEHPEENRKGPQEENPEENPEEDRGGQGSGQIALTETEREEILSEMQENFGRIRLKNGEITSIVVYDDQLRKAAVFGQDFDLAPDQKYLRTEDDFNAVRIDGRDDDFYYYYYYPIFEGMSDDESPVGMCVFRMDHWTLDGTFRNIISDSSAAVFLSDRYIPELSLITSGIAGGADSIGELRDNGDFIVREGNWERGIKIGIAASISENWALEEGIRKAIWPLYFLAVVLLDILIFYSYNHMARPLHGITRFINNAIEHPDDRLKIQREDDIGVVAESLNHMLDENQKMIEEIKEGKIRLYEEQIQRQKMEILAYRNQINPHFLYNTLSCIRDMAVFYDVDTIAEMTMALSDIFRYAVNGSDIVTVKDELDYTQIYATIIRYRHMDKITIRTEADPDALDKHIFRLMLQPLVENAVLHGMVENIGPGTVSVRIRHLPETQQLEIVTSDDGTGMSEEKLAGVREILENPKENESIGISNIVMRLRLFYGEEYSISIDSEEGTGTEVKVIIPDHISAPHAMPEDSDGQGVV